ncbi:hypothetical protein [uncultured Ruthenibacterium sp.]|uniref:hypothetical protein n=1 Tax=uncultured Ruthenibacterium sp. TaxID=1905347 RepID=UPI00349E5BDC
MKRFLLSLFLCITAFTALLPTGAFAASSTVTLTPRQDSAGVTITLPQNVDSGVTSLRLSFQVQLTGGDAEKTRAKFSFAGTLPGSVHEYRYDAQTGRLNLYVAGRDTLFTDGTVTLGSVVLTTEDTNGAAASVSIVEDSLELANAVHSSEKPGVDVQTVELSVGSTADSSSSSDSSVSSSSDATAEPSSPQPGGTTTTGSSSEKVQTSQNSVKKENASSMSAATASSTEASSVASESSSDLSSSSSSSSSQIETETESSSGNWLMYGVIAFLVAAILAALIFFLRRK